MVAAAIIFFAFEAAAASTTIEVKVTVIAPPPCIINENRLIDVNFGSSVQASKVDGSEYLMTVGYNLECKDAPSNAMKLLIQGNATSFDASALQTNIKDFGIALRANGKPLIINEWVKFTYPEKPVLQAVPVKKAGEKLAGGDFSVGASLLVAYQ